jgi:hypothetical protein
VYAVGNKIFPCELPQKEADVTVAWIEIYDFIALWYKGLRNRQAGKILQCRIAMWINGRE